MKISEIILHRTKTRDDATDGYLTIGNERICDTAEHTPFMLPQGRYELSRERCYFMSGNGVYTLRVPGIIVGKYRCHGLVINSQQTYEMLCKRLWKAPWRKRKVVLVVTND